MLVNTRVLQLMLRANPKSHLHEVYGLWVVGCGLWVVGCGLWFVVCGLRFVVRNLNCGNHTATHNNFQTHPQKIAGKFNVAKNHEGVVSLAKLQKQRPHGHDLAFELSKG